MLLHYFLIIRNSENSKYSPLQLVCISSNGIVSVEDEMKRLVNKYPGGYEEYAALSGEDDLKHTQFVDRVPLEARHHIDLRDESHRRRPYLAVGYTIFASNMQVVLSPIVSSVCFISIVLRRAKDYLCTSIG